MPTKRRGYQQHVSLDGAVAAAHLILSNPNTTDESKKEQGESQKGISITEMSGTIHIHM